MQQQKDIYRQEALRHRERMDIRDEDPEIAVENFLREINPATNQIISLFWPKDREFDTIPLIHALLQHNFRVALPVIPKEGRVLLFKQWQEDDDLTLGKYGIMEPVLKSEAEAVLPDIVVVPLLAFDRKGHRLGYGGGYFDVTLEALRAQKQIIAVGIGFSKQAVLFNLPVEEHDQMLDWVITPKDVYCFDETKKAHA